MTRSFTSFSATAQECSDSRVYAGIHWRFDVQTGQAIGNEVGDYVTTHFLLSRDVPSAFESGDGPRVAAPTDGASLSVPHGVLGTLADGVPANNHAQGGAVRGGALNDRSAATATVVDTTIGDRASGSISVAPVGVVWADPIAVVAADFASPDRDGVLGDLSRP